MNVSLPERASANMFVLRPWALGFGRAAFFLPREKSDLIDRLGRLVRLLLLIGRRRLMERLFELLLLLERPDDLRPPRPPALFALLTVLLSALLNPLNIDSFLERPKTTEAKMNIKRHMPTIHVNHAVGDLGRLPIVFRNDKYESIIELLYTKSKKKLLPFPIETHHQRHRALYPVIRHYVQGEGDENERRQKTQPHKVIRGIVDSETRHRWVGLHPHEAIREDVPRSYRYGNPGQHCGSEHEEPKSHPPNPVDLLLVEESLGDVLLAHYRVVNHHGHGQGHDEHGRKNTGVE